MALWCTLIYIDRRGEGLHYKGYIQIYRGCNIFFKFSMERGMIVLQIKFVSYQCSGGGMPTTRNTIIFLHYDFIPTLRPNCGPDIPRDFMSDNSNTIETKGPPTRQNVYKDQ